MKSSSMGAPSADATVASVRRNVCPGAAVCTATMRMPFHPRGHATSPTEQPTETCCSAASCHGGSQ